MTVPEFPSRASNGGRWQHGLLAALAVFAILARWLTRTPGVYGWDSVHYVLAQARYDLAAHQPHPPGSYYYILMARAVTAFTADPHGSLTLLAALSGAVYVWGMFHVARELSGERAAWLAACAGGSAPLFWFYGSIGLNYGPGGSLCLVAALACVWMWRGSRPGVGALLGAGALGVLGGFRPTDVVFLFPAYAASLWVGHRNREGLPLRVILASLGLLGLLTLGWLVPNLLNAGGLKAYLELNRAQEHLLGRSSVFLAGWPAWNEAVFVHRRCLESAGGPAWLLAAWGLGWHLVEWQKVRQAGLAATTGGSRPAIGWLALLIIAPGFLFYLLGHFNSPGYSLTYSGFLAAGLVALAGKPLDALLQSRRVGTGAVAVLCLALLMGNGWLALEGWPGKRDLGQKSLSIREIRDHAAYYRDLNAFLASRDPQSVRLLASWNSTDGLRVVQARVPRFAGCVAQAVSVKPHLPPNFQQLTWLRLMTPEELRAEQAAGREVLAVVRSKEDPAYQEQFFPGGWERVPMGGGHEVWRLRPPSAAP